MARNSSNNSSPSGKPAAKKQKYVQSIQQNEQFYIKTLHPKNLSQQLYVESLQSAALTFCVGPAGSGKSFIATHVALEKLLDGDIDRIVLTRPIVEAGEALGFLPGTLEDKVHPYLLPLLDSLETHIGVKKLQDLMEDGRIVFAPLAYLRGRTFNNTFVILDEAQNTTIQQIKMFITRMGENCFMAIDGDLGQSDLPKHVESGLSWAVRKLEGCDDSIHIVEFRKCDIVRNPLIGKILARLDASDDHQKKPEVLMEQSSLFN
jgi:phosphate starvation-inducible PhoH-like protein